MECKVSAFKLDQTLNRKINMKDKKSIEVLFFAATSTLFALIVGSIIIGAFSPTGNSAEEFGGAIAGVLMLPHLGSIFLGALFGWVSFFTKANWAILTGAILLAVSLVLMPTNFFLSIPIAIIGFVAYVRQKKKNTLHADMA